jgi:2-polyprenyl-3-methyl-5-hydroxy-6-metoxy-1,4-benzoquinol methylase
VKKVAFDASWPDSVKLSHAYDELEFWGSRCDPGYTYSYENRFKIAVDLVTKAAPPPARVLDLAAAQGNFSITLAELGYEVVWNDLRAELADYVRSKHEFGAIEYFPHNVFEIPVDEIGLFDVVLAAEIIEHVAHPDEFMLKLKTLLKPGGTIVLTTPNGAYIRNSLPRFSDCPDPSIFESVQFKPNGDGHIFLPYVDELKAWAEKAGLQVEEMFVFNNFFTRGHMKTGALLRWVPKWLVNAQEEMTRSLPFALRSRVNTALAASFRAKVQASPGV